MSKFRVENWGLIDYNTAWDKQKELVKKIQSGKEQSTLVFCEHPSVITMGKNGTYENLKLSRETLAEKNIEVIDINRGGDVTLHNPRQLVGYPIFDLKEFKQDLHWFLRQIEQSIIDSLKSYQIDSSRVEGLTGVWIDDMRKVCAIGMHCSRWVTSHGFALNVNNDISEFDYIVPCGIEDKEVTSISKELGTEVDFEKLKENVLRKFENNFK